MIDYAVAEQKKQMDAAVDAVNSAYAGDAKLRKRIFDAMNEAPQYAPLFRDIADHQLASQGTAISNGTHTVVTEQPAKKRKLENGTATDTTSQSSQIRQVILEARDISFQLPQRKKFHLSIVQYGANFHDANTTFTLCIRNPATNQVEYEYPTSTFEYALKFLVPEKAQKQYNFCLLPSTRTDDQAVQLLPGEGVIWTINHGPLKSCQINSTELKEIAPGPEDVLENALNAVLSRSGGKLVTPSEAEFACASPESHRKNEKAYHVKAHRGSKDGYLYFLSTGIFFGFKKPLAFFPFHEIEAVSYTAVLQRTFNLIITVMSSSDSSSAEPQEVEFSMLDQADFGGIDAYIKKHQLQDASMAEARRAKQFKVNGKQAADAEGGPGELEKAEAELIDEEDEMEEDYDPEEDGDSDGSGSSEEDDDDYGDGQGGDLVAEELGSEAEEVEEDEEGEAEEEEPAKAAAGHAHGRKGVSRQEPDVDDDDQL